ncbi:MAG: Ig-like domain-containing protein, partial [Marinicella pacifica]
MTRNFEDRVSYNVNGNITMVGNTLLTCDSSNFWCPYIQAGTWSGSNNRDMVFVNVDSAAGYSNSSSATLSLPNGAAVLHAELYWSGRHTSSAANRDKIRIKVPGSGSYTQVTAHTIDTFTSEGSSGSRPYQASADVTQLVANAGSGSYTIADLTAKTGNDSLGFYGGWAIAVVYQDNSQPFRRLMLFDGAARVVDNNTVSITTDNLVTPYSGAFSTYLGALVWEGDQSITGDAFIFEGNTLSDSLNPANNYWNSSITAFNNRVTNKSPDYVNQLAMDLVMTDVSGLLANGETQADIDFVTNGDSYYPHALVFVTDLYLPDFDSSMDKTATDINGGQVEPGDVIEYRVSFQNTGQDMAINTVVSDTLPNGVTYVPNSLEIVNAPGSAGAMTDQQGDDNAEYDANSNTLTFWVGSNALWNQGGDFLPGESAVVKFLAVVDEQGSGSVSNTATIDFNAQTTPNEPLSAQDDAVINVVANAAISVTKTAQLTIDTGNPGTADAGDEITFSIVVNNTGNLSMNNIQLADPMAPGGIVTCPANTLAAQSSMTCDNYGYTVTLNDINTGGYINNTVDLAATDGSGGSHQDSDNTQTELTLATPTINSPLNGALLNDNTPTVSGTGPVGAQIDVVTDQGGGCQAIVDGSGNWSCDISPAQNDGSLIISAFASDGGSNQSGTDSVTVDLDATAPGAPGVNAPTNGQPITGTGEPGATVTVVTDNGDSCTAVVDGNGDWYCDLGPGVVDGDNITVTQEDEAGNVSPPTVINGGIDTQAPTIIITAPVTGDLTNDNTPTVSGTSEAGADISVTIGGVEVCTAVADNNGDWSCDVSPAVADGSVQIDVTATDAANNTSNPESVSINVDTTAPDAPVINAPTNGQPVSGTGEPYATVVVTTPGGATCTTTVQANGTWSCDLTGN